MFASRTPGASLVLALFFSTQASGQVRDELSPVVQGAFADSGAADLIQEPDAATAATEPDTPSELLTAIQAQQYRRTVAAVFDARIRYELGEDPGEALAEGATASAAGAVTPGSAIELPGDVPLSIREQLLAAIADDGAAFRGDLELDSPPPVTAGEVEAPLGSAEDSLLAQQQAARFEFWVMAGAWPEVERFLAEDAGDDAAAIFAHLLAQLAAGDQVMLPLEALELCASAPEALEDDQVEQLIALLKKTEQRASLEAVPPALADHPQFAIAGAESRARGAKLLTGLGLIDALEPYLPEMEEAETRPDVLVQHARYHQYLADQATDFSSRMVHLNHAFELLRSALNSENADAGQRGAVLAVVLELLPELPESQVAVWRRTLFAEGKGFGLSALSGVVSKMDLFERSRAVRDDRIPVVREAKALGEVLVALTPLDEAQQAQTALGLVAASLVKEAEFSLGAKPDEYPYYQWGDNGREPTFIETSDLLQWMPSVDWMARVDAGLAERLMRIRVRLAAQARLPQDALETVELAAARRSGLAQELAELFLAEWTSALEAQRVQGVDQGMSIYYVNGVRQVNPGAAPLTRAHQMRSLQKLAEVLSAFAAMDLEAMAPEALVEGFAACHSSAEVYQVEDIERLLGPIEAMQPRMATALADNMRRNLNSRWRSSQVQTTAGTKRNKVQMEAEMERGYLLAERILARSIEQEPDGWMNVLVRAALMFDFAEFSHERDPDMRDYAPIRDSSFASFQHAASLYAEEVKLGKEEPQVLPYALWFASALGASELGYLTPNTRPENDQVDLVRAAMLELPEELAAAHLDLFASWTNGLNVPAVVKPRFLRHALRVLGDHGHSAAKAARARLQLYDELVQEVLLVAEVDGTPEVGADQPFGIRVGLRYTAALEREAGGFTKYLQNQVYTPASSGQVDYRDRFEEQIREKLYESFEVDTIQFHRPEVEDRAVGVHGWMEKPLAYVVVRARDEAVDRIPAMQLDMDFSDGQSTVMLPVTSPVVLLDARNAEMDVRPYERLEVEQVLDAREWAEQKLLLEVRTRGRGVLPNLASLLPSLREIDGFAVTEVESHPLNITELDAESSPVMPLTERSWTVHLQPQEESTRAAFAFPAVALESESSTLRRYQDLDVVDAEPVVELDRSVLGGGGLPWWGWLLFAVVAVAIWKFLVKPQQAPEEVAEVLPLPRQLSALSALAYLRKVGAESSVASRAEWREALELEIHELERKAFAEGGELPEPEQLRALLQQWRDRAVA